MKKYNLKGGFLGMNVDNVVFVFYGVIVVMDFWGRCCFFYIGWFWGLKIWLGGICVDVMLYIFVCDGVIELVYIIDKDG